MNRRYSTLINGKGRDLLLLLLEKDTNNLLGSSLASNITASSIGLYAASNDGQVSNDEVVRAIVALSGDKDFMHEYRNSEKFGYLTENFESTLEKVLNNVFFGITVTQN